MVPKEIQPEYLGHITNNYLETTRISVLTHTFLVEISLISWERSVYTSEFFQEEQIGTNWGQRLKMISLP